MTKLNEICFTQPKSGRIFQAKMVTIDRITVGLTPNGRVWTTWDVDYARRCLNSPSAWSKGNQGYSFMRCLVALDIITSDQLAVWLNKAEKAEDADQVESDRSAVEEINERYGIKLDLTKIKFAPKPVITTMEECNGEDDTTDF